jgi:DNA-binding transcriptional LysR family regulator
LPRQNHTGRVRLGTGATACIHLLPPVLTAVKRAMPGLMVTVAIGNAADVLARLEAGDLDVASVTMPVPVGRVLSTTRLVSDPLMALLPEGDTPNGSAPVTAAQLAGLPLILYEAGGNTRNITGTWSRYHTALNGACLI